MFFQVIKNVFQFGVLALLRVVVLLEPRWFFVICFIEQVCGTLKRVMSYFERVVWYFEESGVVL